MANLGGHVHRRSWQLSLIRIGGQLHFKGIMDGTLKSSQFLPLSSLFIYVIRVRRFILHGVTPSHEVRTLLVTNGGEMNEFSLITSWCTGHHIDFRKPLLIFYSKEMINGNFPIFVSAVIGLNRRMSIF